MDMETILREVLDEIRSVKSDVRELKEGQTRLETRFVGLEKAQAGLETRFAGLEQAQAGLQTRLGELAEGQARIEKPGGRRVSQGWRKLRVGLRLVS